MPTSQDVAQELADYVRSHGGLIGARDMPPEPGMVKVCDVAHAVGMRSCALAAMLAARGINHIRVPAGRSGTIWVHPDDIKSIVAKR